MYLLYCIFHGSEVQRTVSLPGVDGQPVFPVSVNSIIAAVSVISETHLTPDVPRIMAYQKVIESFHGSRTVIPMRYGCVLRDRPQVIQCLSRNARQYESLLKELNGCVEMGIRVLIEDCRLSIKDLRDFKFGPLNSESENFNPKSKITGRAYLVARKAHYDQEERITEAKNEIAGQFRTALSGLFVESKIETPPMLNRQSSMLALYFLIPKKAIDPFRRVFSKTSRQMETTKLLLSGPYPPYNFVQPGNEQRRLGGSDKEAKERCPER